MARSLSEAPEHSRGREPFRNLKRSFPDLGAAPHGFLTIATAAVGLAIVMAGNLPAQHPTSGAYRWGLEVETGGAEPLRIELPVEDLAKARRLGIERKSPGFRVRVLRYVPNAIVRERAVAAASGPAAVLIRGRLGATTLERWLVARDPARQRLETAFLNLTYRGPVGEPALREERQVLSALLRPEPMLLVERRRDGRRTVHRVQAGEKIELESPPRSIEVRRLIHFFGIDPKGEAVERGQPGKPVNPAVELAVKSDEKARKALLFSRFPQFSKGGADPDYVLSFHWKAEANPHAKLSLVLLEREGELVLLESAGAEVRERRLALGRPEKLIDLEFEVAERLPRARITQEIELGPEVARAPALELELQAGEERTIWWIRAGTSEAIPLGDRTVQARFGPAGGRGGKKAGHHPPVHPRK